MGIIKLTIAIPTFQRAEKLGHVLACMSRQILAGNFQDRVDILVGDNCSSDQTQNILREAISRSSYIRCYLNASNIGLDENMRLLYERSKGQYVWFFSDDDEPFENALTTIISSLEFGDLSVLLYSFQQPRGSRIKTFADPRPFYTCCTRKDRVEHVIKSPKLSHYILAKVALSKNANEHHLKYIGTNYWFLGLCFSILGSGNENVGVITSQLACSDREYANIRFDAQTWGRLHLVLDHPYVTSLPDYGKFLRNQEIKSNGTLAIFLWSYKVGLIKVTMPESYELGIKNFPWLNIPPLKFTHAVKIILTKLCLAQLTYRIIVLVRALGKTVNS